MRKSVAALTVVALVPFAFVGCVSKGEYMKTVDAANALEVDNARLKNELADAGRRNEQLTADRAELERLLAARSGELGKSIAELRQRVPPTFERQVRDHLAVHNRKGEPCPRCGERLEAVHFAEHVTTYCPAEQTGGRILKDRRLSKLLK